MTVYFKVFLEESSLPDTVIAYITTTEEDNGQNSMTNVNVFDESLFSWFAKHEIKTKISICISKSNSLMPLI